MLAGPPGNGKTTMIGALAYALGLNLYTPNLGQMTDETLAQAIKAMNRGILVLEDIDRASVTHSRDTEETFQEFLGPPQGTGISLSGLLNALDGINTPNGLITIATTNKLETIDAALLRKGRMDKIIQFQNPKRDEIQRLCSRFDLPQKETESLTNEWEREGVSMATVQERLIEKTLQNQIIPAEVIPAEENTYPKRNRPG